MTNALALRPSAPCISGWPMYNYHDGVDTLHLTYYGQIRPSYLKQFKNLKDNAKEKIDLERCVIALAGTPIRVLPHGAGRFAFALSNDDFFITVSAGSGSMPVCQVQIKSEGIFRHGAEQCCIIADAIARELAMVDSQHVARLDICNDFSTDYNFVKLTRMNYVSRSRRVAINYEGAHFEGMSTPKGADVVFRLYEKTREIKKSGKLHWQEKWAEKGYEKGKVYRAEFELHRRELKEIGIESWADALASVPRLWAHYTTNWIRIILPSDTDSNTRRWDTAEFWKSLQQFYGDWPEQKVTRREKKISDTSSSYKFRNGFSAILSHMARTGQTSMTYGIESFFKEAEQYHGGYEALLLYLRKKYREKRYAASKMRPDLNGWFVPGAEYVKEYVPSLEMDDLESIPY